MKRILVTGGAGYIGSHACKALAVAGYSPICFDNLTRGHRNAVQWGPLIQGDLCDLAAVNQVIAETRPLAVLHFAAFAYVGESVADPGMYYRNNFVGTLNLLESMRRHSIDQLVFSSTCATYGVPEKLPLTEEHPQRPINPYGASKLMVERMIADFGAAHGLRSISLRYFNAAGADAECSIGEHHVPETHLIPLVLEAADSTTPMTVHGDDYDTPDGTCIRDYIHVADLAEAHVLALRALDSGTYSAAYNLGNGRGYSVRQIIAAVETVTGMSIPVRIGNRRPGDPPVLVGDATKFISELGWKIQHPELSGIIESAWRWHTRRKAAITSDSPDSFAHAT
jgi:UDP-arabinose 4-epimerase